MLNVCLLSCDQPKARRKYSKPLPKQAKTRVYFRIFWRKQMNARGKEAFLRSFYRFLFHKK